MSPSRTADKSAVRDVRRRSRIGAAKLTEHVLRPALSRAEFVMHSEKNDLNVVHVHLGRLRPNLR